MSKSLLKLHRELIKTLNSACIITLIEAATILDVCPTTVRRMTNDGRLYCLHYPGEQGKKRRMFWLEDILDLAESRLELPA